MELQHKFETQQQQLAEYQRVIDNLLNQQDQQIKLGKLAETRAGNLEIQRKTRKNSQPVEDQPVSEKPDLRLRSRVSVLQASGDLDARKAEDSVLNAGNSPTLSQISDASRDTNSPNLLRSV